jgi:hypothetical protein
LAFTSIAKAIQPSSAKQGPHAMKVSWLLTALLLLPPFATAEIFKCTDAKKGAVKYQNFPCQIDSIGSKATAAAPKEESLQPVSAPQVATAQPAMANRPGPASGEVAHGMTMEQVHVAAGAPLEKETSPEGEIWYYAPNSAGDKRIVRFDAAGLVHVVETVE